MQIIKNAINNTKKNPRRLFALIALFAVLPIVLVLLALYWVMFAIGSVAKFIQTMCRKAERLFGLAALSPTKKILEWSLAGEPKNVKQ